MELAPPPPREVGSKEPPSRTPTMAGLGPPPRASSGKLRLVRGGQTAESAHVDDNSEESAFFERGDDSGVLGAMTSDCDADPARAFFSSESIRRRAAYRRVAAGVVGFASILAALAAVKVMVGPRRGSLEPTPEPTEPVVVVMQRLDAVVSPAAGSSSATPSAPEPAASPSKTRVPRHLAQGRGTKNARPHRPLPR